MRKLTLLALVAFVSGAAFAQEEAPAVKRTFRAYFDAISGQVVTKGATAERNGDTTTVSPGRNLWAGNEYEIGLGYSQNWAKVPWLTTSFVVKFGINPVWANDPTDGSSIGRVNNQNNVWIRGQFGLDLTKYFSFYMDSRLLTGLTLQYAWTGGAHSIMLQTGIEFFAGNYSLSGSRFKAMRQANIDGTIDREGAAGPMIDDFWVDLVWTARMPMGFANTLLLRPVGFSGDNPSEIAEGYYIRIQETLSWSNAGFTAYLRLRYNIKRIAAPTYDVAGSADKYRYGIWHDLTLRAGVSYAYDFSKL